VLASLLAILGAYPGVNKGRLLEHLRASEFEHFDYLHRLSAAPFLSDVPEEGKSDELVGALDSLSKSVREAEGLRPFNGRSTADWTPEVRDQLDRAFDPARTRRR
jgi:hypothetical protein